MTPIFRYSPRPNRAHEIAWRDWGASAFEEAQQSNRPILLNLSAVWCHWCHEMDETTYSDSAVIDLINASLIPIRVDADRYPHVQDRYIAGGWPTNAFLTSTGEVLWAGTYTQSAELLQVAHGVIAAWGERREEFELEIERRRRALEASRSRTSMTGLVRREASDDVVTAVRAAFDARNGGFGEAPKFPPGDIIELLYSLAAQGDADALAMADRTLDGMLAGELLDRDGGGFFRYATSADWTAPRYEKLLEINALQLESYAVAACVRARPDWEEIAHHTVAWVDQTLALPNGLWAGSQYADEEYFALARAARNERTIPAIDQTTYTSWNAMWIGALAIAGGRLNVPAWIERAEIAMHTLLAEMSSPNGLLFHYKSEEEDRAVDFLLVDAVEAARAALLLFQSTGKGEWLADAHRIAIAIEKSFSTEEGGFWDRATSHDDVGALRYRDRPFELNARTARFLLDLSFVTGERGFRALAERTLALLSPQAGRFGVAGATFALAVEEYFVPPPCVVIVGDTAATASLRTAALVMPSATRRVWTLPRGGRIGTQSIPATPSPAAYACGRRGCSAPVVEERALAAVIASLA